METRLITWSKRSHKKLNTSCFGLEIQGQIRNKGIRIENLDLLYKNWSENHKQLIQNHISLAADLTWPCVHDSSIRKRLRKNGNAEDASTFFFVFNNKIKTFWLLHMLCFYGSVLAVSFSKACPISCGNCYIYRTQKRKQLNMTFWKDFYIRGGKSK